MPACVLRLIGAGDFAAGPLVGEFRLTLTPGFRTEVLGPLFYSEIKGLQEQGAFVPLLSHTYDRGTDSEEFDILYPVLSYDRFGSEYRFHFFQLFSVAGGGDQDEDVQKRVTVFPIYFHQRSTDPEKNYTAVFPFYGKLRNRIFRAEIDFVMWPIYVKTRRRGPLSDLPNSPDLAAADQAVAARRRDVTTYNYFYPIVHRRFGDGLSGWQVWPFIGREEKTITTHTNNWGDPVTVPGYKETFVLWPIYFNETQGIGGDNPEKLIAVLPFYTRFRSPLRDSTSFLWPWGFAYTDDRRRKYREWDFPWPFFVIARGEGKTGNRFFPFYSRMVGETLESGFVMWPIYKYNRIHSPPLDRVRTRSLFFFYSHVREKDEDRGTVLNRTDLWPFFTHVKGHNGDERLQILALLEPLLPASKSIVRNYSPLWSIWRAEKSLETGASSQSLLWNLYRRDTAPRSKRVSFLFGLYQYRSDSEGKRVRLFYLPILKKPPDSSDRN